MSAAAGVLSSPRAPGRGIERRILGYSPRARRCLALAVAAGALAAALTIAQAWLLATTIARVFPAAGTLADVRVPLVLLLVCAIARAAALAAGEVLAQRAANNLKGAIHGDLTAHLLALGPRFTGGERSGELVNVAGPGVEDLDPYMTAFQPARALAAVVPVLVAIAVLVADPLTVLVLLVTGPVLVLLLTLIGQRTDDLTSRRFAELGWMSAAFLDMLQGLATLKMFGRSGEQVENIRAISREYGATTMHVLRTAFETTFVLEMSATIAIALVAVEAGLRLMDGAIPFERALFVLIVTPEFFAPLRQLSLTYHAGAAGRAAAGRIFAVLDTPAPQPAAAGSRTLPVAPAGDLRFEHVSFSYGDGRRPALDGVSFCVPEGAKVALAGASGAGKSTLVSLLLRFAEPGGGAILVGGTPLTAIDLAAWRACVAWVPQRPHLFYGTVADNLRIARPDATEREVIVAATAADAHEFIRALPRGYDTPIGERGVRLSGGERQRIAIARAFLKDAPWLVLDEATSHLDAASEALIREALVRLMRGRSVLIIAHRLEMTALAGCVVMLHEGRLVAEGPPAELATGSIPYRRLIAAYAADEL